MERRMIDETENDRKTQIVKNLLQKPAKKPDFSSFKGSNVLKRVQEFMPMFIQTTDRLLSDPELLKQNQMDILLEENGDEQQLARRLQKDLLNQKVEQEGVYDDFEDNEMDDRQIQDPKTICMDIGVGVYDVNNQNYDEKGFQPSSTKPIVRFHGLEKADDESDDSDSDSDDSNLYYEFNSDQESNIDSSSAATKDTSVHNKSQQIKKPLIVDITSEEEAKKNNTQKSILKKRKHNQKK